MLDACQERKKEVKRKTSRLNMAHLRYRLTRVGTVVLGLLKNNNKKKTPKRASFCEGFICHLGPIVDPDSGQNCPIWCFSVSQLAFPKCKATHPGLYSLSTV